MRNQSIVYRGDVFPDGTTDVTRTMHYGTPTNLEREIYTNLLMGCINLASTKFPEGQTLNTLEVLIRAPLYSMGLDYGHGSTHGVGAFLGVHEGNRNHLDITFMDGIFKPLMIFEIISDFRLEKRNVKN
uniref:Peptidase M24 domain-containing protein n=1 Tax=Timema douglasi TaxID=61478 RepID=A0A7R8VRG9_TIMDO|nr:unnamed protein product [Timema douglasi]